MASATLHLREKRISLDISDETMLAVRVAASAVIARREGQPIQSVSADQCTLTPGKEREGSRESSRDERGRAKVFFADMIAGQRLRRGPLTMPLYAVNELPEVLQNVASPIGDWFRSEELILAELNALYLATRDALRYEPGEGGYWLDTVRFAEILMKCDGKIPGPAAEELIRSLSTEADHWSATSQNEVFQRVLGDTKAKVA
jgi:hypothetical protein